MLNEYAAALEHLADLRAEAQAAQRVTELMGGRRPRRRWLRSRRHPDAAVDAEVGHRRSGALRLDGHYR